jgi:hypothetical protein
MACAFISGVTARSTTLASYFSDMGAAKAEQATLSSRAQLRDFFIISYLP